MAAIPRGGRRRSSKVDARIGLRIGNHSLAKHGLRYVTSKRSVMTSTLRRWCSRDHSHVSETWT